MNSDTFAQFLERNTSRFVERENGRVAIFEPDAAVEIARQDAMGACVAWKKFTEGHRKALNDPRLGHVMETLGYMSGLRSGLPFTQAVQFGEWLSNKITGWTDGEATESDVRHLERVAKQAAFRPAVLLSTIRPAAA